MAIANFLVCESSPRWIAALRWGLGDGRSRLVIAPSLDHCWEMLNASPASFLALELNEANLEAIVQRMQNLRSEFPFARAAVMCDRRLAHCQWLVREAGAVHVATSIREVAAIIRIADRHIAEAPRPEVGYRQQVWDRMPWQDA